MILVREDKGKYKEKFSKKFRSFADKSPILLSYVTDEQGVTVIHENSGTKYFYEWEPEIPIKSFIHHIKQELSNNHYPRIAREVEITRAPNDEEVAKMIAEGTKVDEVPETITYNRTEVYRIDKFVAMEDEFVIVDEETEKQYCYKMNVSGIYFLKNYRTGKFKSILEAGNEFFSKSKLITELNGTT